MVPAPLLCAAADRVVHQYPPHRLCRNRQEMRAVLPAQTVQSTSFTYGLVKHQR